MVRRERIARRRRDEQSGEAVGRKGPHASEQGLEHEHSHCRRSDDRRYHSHSVASARGLRDEHRSDDEPNESEIAEMRGKKHDGVEERRAHALLDEIEDGEVHAVSFAG